MEALVSTVVASTTETTTAILLTNIGLIMVAFAGLLAAGIMIRVLTNLLGRGVG